MYSYIYIYIYSHPQADCFRLRNHKVLCSNSSSNSFCLFTFYALPDTRVLNSSEVLCIMRASAKISFARVLNPHGERIYCHPQTDCFVVSQLFIGHLKLGSKPAQLYVRLSIRQLGQ